MGESDIFGVVWTGIIVFMMAAGLVLAVAELRSGYARMSFWIGNDRVRREEEPAHYWFAVIGKLVVVPVGAAMIYMASDVFW